VDLRFAIPGWSACAPGPSTPAAWQEWGEHPGLQPEAFRAARTVQEVVDALHDLILEGAAK
jgi:hypothetical protein